MASLESVGGPYPCWIEIKLRNGQSIRIAHTELLSLEHAVAEAKRQVLCKLDRKDWREVDSKLAV